MYGIIVAIDWRRMQDASQPESGEFAPASRISYFAIRGLISRGNHNTGELATLQNFKGLL